MGNEMVGKVINETKDHHGSPTDKENYGHTSQKRICSTTTSVNFVMLTWRPKKIQNMILQAHDEIKVSGVVESLLHFSLLSFKETHSQYFKFTKKSHFINARNDERK